jgi:uncharacterized protein YecE (DUF72 family)
MTLWVGTSGFAYKEWKGSFCPEDLETSGMLSYCGERLNAVEINSTFPRMPKRDVLSDRGSMVAEDGHARLRRERYEEGERAAWADRISEPRWKDALVFLKHEDGGAGPALAAAFRKAAGVS